MTRKQSSNGKVGYVFWHEQDHERIPDGYVNLRFGATDPTATSIEVAAEVVKILSKNSKLQVTWNGTAASCVHVADANKGGDCDE